MVVREVNQKPNKYTSSVIIVLLAEPHGNNHHVLFEVMIAASCSTNITSVLANILLLLLKALSATMGRVFAAPASLASWLRRYEACMRSSSGLQQLNN